MPMPPPSPNQSRIIWMAVTALAVATLLASLGAIVWLLGRVLHIFAPVLWPLAIAAIVAYLLDPVVDWLSRRGVGRRRAILLVFAIAAALVIALGAMIIPRLVYETRELASRIPDYAARIQDRALDWLQRSGWRLSISGFRTSPPPPAASTDTNTVPATNLNLVTTNATMTVTNVAAPDAPWEGRLASAAVGWLPKALPRIGQWLADQVSRVAAWFGLLAGIALVPVYAFYFLLEKKGIKGRWTDYLPITESRAKEELVFALNAINDRLIVFFRGQVLVAACDGVLYGIGFAAVGLNFAVLMGVIAGVLSIIPYLGAVLTIVPAVVLAAVQFHDWLHPLLVVLVFAVVQLLEGFVISPKIIGDRVGLHPLTIIIAVLMGTTLLGGILGGILAIPLTAALRELMFRYVWKKRQ